MVGVWFEQLKALSRRLSRSDRGGVALIGALSLSVMIGMGAFAVEASQGYAAKVSNQRIADQAALAGALAYNVGSDQNAMRKTAAAVVQASGLASTAVDTVLTTDSSGNPVVKATVTTAVPLSLGKAMGQGASYDVVSVGMASTSATATVAPPCISALSSAVTYGVTLSGGTTISSPGCAIATNSGVTVPWGTYITAQEVDAGKTINNPGSGITTTPTAGKIYPNKATPATDWIKDSTALKAALCQVNKLTGTSDADYPDGNTVCTSVQALPASQTASGAAAQDWTLNYSPAANVSAYRQGTSANYIIPAGTYTIRTLTLAGGITATFQGPVTLKIDAVDMSGDGLTIGDGNVTVVGTFGFNSGSTITIGNGNHSFGNLTLTGGRTLTIGTGDLTVTGSISLAGGSHLRANVGVGDEVRIGNNGSGTAINVAGGSDVCFTAACAAPTAATDGFSANGSVVTAGGSTIIFNKALNHVINGDLNLNGSSTFGSGLYVIRNNFTNNTGGSMTGADVTFALGGTFTLAGGTSLNLAAPSSSSSYGVPNILIATKSSSATTIGGGSSNRYAGLVYAPKSNILLDGGASMSSSSANCLMMIVNTLTLNGGTAVGSACSGLTGSSSSVAKVALVQ